MAEGRSAAGAAVAFIGGWGAVALSAGTSCGGALIGVAGAVWGETCDGPAEMVAAIEGWVGMRPDLDDVDQKIAQLRREKEDAIDTQAFETAAALRDKEKQLLAARASREKEWVAATGDRPSLAAEFGRVNAELERLRAILREHGLDTDNGAA
jgi:hypothetical protein